MKPEPKLSWKEMMSQPLSPPETPRVMEKPARKKPLWCAFLCAGDEPDEKMPDVSLNTAKRVKK